MEKNRFKTLLEETKILVEPTVEELLSPYSGTRFADAVLYQIRAGGKRLRPALLFLACRALGGKDEDALYTAAAVEILHNYSLIIDDIIDNSEIRRGIPTVWKKWGMAATECVGVHYSASIFRGALRSPCPSQVADTLADTLQILVEGEIIDVLQERTGREDEFFVSGNRYKKIEKDNALEMMSKKTAELFKSTCFLGGLCAKGEEKELEKLKEYGFNLGMAFQMRDDVLDIFGEEKKFGKKIGKDIEERKGGNIVILFALEENEEIEKILYKRSLKDEDLKEGMEMIKRTNAKDRAMELCNEYVRKAKESLYHLPENKERGTMEEIVDYLLKREK